MSEVKKDVLSALTEAIVAIKGKQYANLQAVSDHVLHATAIYQEEDLVDVAVAIYALDKILETEKYLAHPKRKQFIKTTLHLLQKAAGLLEQEHYADFCAVIKEILSNIEGFSKSIRFYIEDILHFARIKKGTKLYEHGLSLGQAAELVGVTKWELMPAIGETAIHEQLSASKEINEKRIKFAEKIFIKQKRGKAS